MVFSEKIIDEQSLQEVKELIKMTRIAQLFEQEKRKAVGDIARQKKKVEAERDKALDERNDALNALVSGIESLSKNMNISVREACEQIGQTYEQYVNAKNLCKKMKSALWASMAPG